MGFGLSGYIPFCVYVATIAVIVVTLVYNIKIGIYFAVLLVPLTNLFMKMEAYPLGKNLNDILFAALLIGWYFQNRRSGSFLKHSDFNKAIFVLIAYSYVSLWIGYLYYNDNVPITADSIRLATWKSYIMSFVLFVIVYNNIEDRKDIWRIILIMGFSIALVNYKFNDEFKWVERFHYAESMRDISGTFGYLNSNHVGAFLGQYAIFLASIAVYDGRVNVRNILLALLAAWSLQSMLYSFSRGAYVGAVIGVSVVFLARHKLVFLALLVLSAVLWQDVLPNSVVERIQMTINSEGELDDSTQSRLTLWDESMKMARRNPVTGLGFDTYSHGESRYLGYKDPHNYYIKTLSEQGIIGLAILLYIFYLAIRRSYLLYSRSSDPLFGGIGLGGIAATLFCLLSNFFGDRWSYFMLSGYYWVFLAIIERGNELASSSVACNEPEAGAAAG